jgi:hypothetical protein
MKNIKKFLKNIFFLRRIKDGIFATSYFNKKYLLILKWMFTSKEDTNFTYNLEHKNLNELYKLIETVFNIDFYKIEKYSEELLNNYEIKTYLLKKIKSSNYKNFADDQIMFSRRIGWYIIARILKPKIIVETGVDKGLGSVILAEALIKNKSEGFNGKYYGTDINLKAGYLFDEIYSEMGQILYGDSIESLKNFNQKIDLFINDSDHSAEYEKNEYLTIKNKLTPNAIILGDNSHSTDELLNFSIINKRNFVLFNEKPKNHWYPGGGIGISYIKQ